MGGVARQWEVWPGNGRCGQAMEGVARQCNVCCTLFSPAAAKKLVDEGITSLDGERECVCVDV